MSQNDISLSPEELDVFLTRYFRYYTTLDKEWRHEFVKRVIKFANTKWFVPQKGFEINNQVKAIIASSAVQLTLGLKEWTIDYFNTILLFSNDFKNEISGLRLKGETNLNGFVSFSWKSFIEGYKIPDDNLNLGLHEFTHALRFNGVRGNESDEFFNGYFPKWYAYARSEFLKLKNGGPSIFRKYGGANINEFLSVAVEHFFESPEEFKKELPLFYSATAILLNQKTNGTNTKINIRKEEIELQEQQFRFKDMPGYRPKFIPYAAIFCFMLSLFTAFYAGVFSFPSLFLFFITTILFIRSDYTYSYFTVEEQKLNLSKGFLLFRKRESLRISLPQMIWTEFANSENRESSMVLCYFDHKGFYEEELSYSLDEGKARQLLAEMKQGYVWVK